MLLSEGRASLQMSEELMSQWGFAPLGRIASRHSRVWVCLLLSVGLLHSTLLYVYFRLSWKYALFFLLLPQVIINMSLSDCSKSF